MLPFPKIISKPKIRNFSFYFIALNFFLFHFSKSILLLVKMNFLRKFNVSADPERFLTLFDNFREFLELHLMWLPSIASISIRKVYIHFSNCQQLPNGIKFIHFFFNFLVEMKLLIETRKYRNMIIFFSPKGF